MVIAWEWVVASQSGRDRCQHYCLGSNKQATTQCGITHEDLDNTFKGTYVVWIKESLKVHCWLTSLAVQVIVAIQSRCCSWMTAWHALYTWYGVSAACSRGTLGLSLGSGHLQVHVGLFGFCMLCSHITEMVKWLKFPVLLLLYFTSSPQSIFHISSYLISVCNNN